MNHHESRSGRTLVAIGGGALLGWLLLRGGGWGLGGRRSAAAPVGQPCRVHLDAEGLELDGVRADLPVAVSRCRTAGAADVTATGAAIVGAVGEVLAALTDAGVIVRASPVLWNVAGLSRPRGAVDPEPYLAARRYLTLPTWSTSAIRNSRLIYRPVGLRGEPYPDWLRGLKGKSGAYVIREEGRPVYIGESHTGRLYETLTRHFQTWRRQKGFWKGYVEGHDPGLTYDRDGVDVAVRVTSANDAIDEELRLIGRLHPRDNLLGQPEEEDVPF